MLKKFTPEKKKNENRETILFRKEKEKPQYSYQGSSIPVL